MIRPFPASPSITLFDPLAQFLGAGDGHFHYTFEDVVKLSGHACPTVAGAFLMTIHAMNALYGEAVPQRGGVRISMPGAVDQGVNGPISQVFTLLAGAAAESGFHGLGGQFQRDGLMTFGSEEAGGFLFQRMDNGHAVRVGYDPSPVAADPAMPPLMQQALQGVGDSAALQQFQSLWRARVLELLEDGGRETVTVAVV